MEIRTESPFPEYAWPRVWSWIETFRHRVADDFGPKTLEEFVEQRMAATHEKTWAVYRDGELGGIVSFQALTPWLGTAHCLFKKNLWGFETTIPALRAVAEEIFATGIWKLTVMPFRDNLQIKGVLKRLGAECEGTLREHTVREGKPVDVLLYGLTRKRFEDAIRSSSTDNCVSDRGRSLGGGIPAEREAENQHELVDTNTIPGDAATPEPVARV